jgi:hypothetical protein
MRKVIKVKLPLYLTKYHAMKIYRVVCLIKHHIMKTYGELELWHNKFLTSALDGGELSDSHHGTPLVGE